MQYVNQNRKALGVNAKLQIVQKVKGRSQPLKTSNINEIIKYHFGEKGNKQPTGYKKFISRCENDMFLKHKLGCVREEDEEETQDEYEDADDKQREIPANQQSTSVKGWGFGFGLKPREYSPIRIYGVKKSHCIKFKPSLWKIKELR